MTVARSKIRTIYLLLVSILQPTTLILCVLDVGLAGRVCFISTIPHLPPSTPNLSSDQLITINFHLFVGGSGEVYLCPVHFGQSQAYPGSTFKVSTTFLISEVYDCIVLY